MNMKLHNQKKYMEIQEQIARLQLQHMKLKHKQQQLDSELFVARKLLERKVHYGKSKVQKTSPCK